MEPRRPAVVWAIRLLKVIVIVAVVAFVWRTVTEAWRELSTQELSIEPLWAIASGLLLALAQVPMAWFWRRAVIALGQPAPWFAAYYAYVISQIGKYVPGKASVVLIRTERLLRASSPTVNAPSIASSPATIGASVFYETLLHMAVGSLLAAGLSMIVLFDEPGWRIPLVAISLGTALACVTPTLPPVFAWILHRVLRNKDEGIEAALQRRLTYRLSACGLVASLVAWCLVAGAVYSAARSVDVAAGWTPEAIPMWLLAGTLPVVAGFVSLLPAGVLVREALTLGVLSPALGEADALAATIAIRLIWVATEAILCGSLLVGGAVWRRRNTESP